MESMAAPFRVLFLCTGNSARSQIAALERHGYFWTGGSPKSVDGMVNREWDFVITVAGTT